MIAILGVLSLLVVAVLATPVSILWRVEKPIIDGAQLSGEITRAVATGKHHRAAELGRTILAHGQLPDSTRSSTLIEVAVTLADVDSLAPLVTRLLEQALADRQRLLMPADPAVLEVLELLSLVAFNTDQFERSAQLDSEALELRRSSGEEVPAEILASSYYSIAASYYAAGMYFEAERNFGLADQAILRSVGRDPLLSAAILNGSGETARTLGRSVVAEAAFDSALVWLERAKQVESHDSAWLRDLRWSVLMNSAGLMYDRAQYPRAETTYRMLLDEALSDERSSSERALALRNVAATLEAQGRRHEARVLLSRTQSELLPKFDSTGRFWISYQLAELSLDAGDLSRAHEEGMSAMEIAESSEDRALLPSAYAIRGRIQLASGDPRCVDSSRKAVQLFREVSGDEAIETAVARLLLAQAIWSIDNDAYRTSEVLSSAELCLADRAERPDAQIQTDLLRAKILVREGRKDLAAVKLEQAVGNTQRLTHRLASTPDARARAVQPYFEASRMLALHFGRLGDIGRALETVERARATALRTQLALSGVDLFEGIEEPERTSLAADLHLARARVRVVSARIGRLQARPHQDPATTDSTLSSLRTDLAAAEASVQQSLEAIYRESSVRNRLADDRPPSIADIQSRLQPGEVFLEYVIGDEAAAVVVVPSAGEPSIAELVVNKAEAEVLGVSPGIIDATRIADLIGDRDSGVIGRFLSPLQVIDSRLAEELKALRSILLPRDAGSGLATAERITIVPDGPLHAFPFGLLGGTGVDEAVPVVCTPSAAVLVKLRQSKEFATEPRIVCIANPRLSPTSVQALAGLPEALPGADREAEAIEDAWKGRSVILLRGEQATEAAVRTAIPMGDIVQFSCHSIVQKVFSFSDGAILLGSGDEIHDGILTSKELAALDWRADLVILASCRSLDGEMIEGEGTLSLARSLLVGGVSHVVASLWPVGDEATARLMAGLHRGLAAGRGPVEALAIAQAEELMLRGSSDFDPTVMGFMVIGR